MVEDSVYWSPFVSVFRSVSFASKFLIEDAND